MRSYRVTILVGLLVVLLLGVTFLTLWLNKPSSRVHLHRRSQCLFSDFTVMDAGTAFKDGCQRCVCLGSNSFQCETVGGCEQDYKIHVVITADENSLGGLIALVNSIHHHTNSSVLYHLITTKDAEDHLRKWLNVLPLKNVNCSIVVFPESWVKDKIQDRGSRHDLERPINYARTYLPTLLPEIHSKIIYIDADCIVQGDIAELWRTNLRRGDVAAFSSDCTHLAKRGNMFHNRLASYLNFNNPLVHSEGLRPESCSFNTGVFVTDLDLWRHSNITQKLEYWMELNVKEEVYGSREGGGGQQPLFLIVFRNKFTDLDPFWNIRQLGSVIGRQYPRDFVEKVHLLHWSGRMKPWDAEALYTDLWDKYYVPDPLGKFRVVRKYKQNKL